MFKALLEKWLTGNGVLAGYIRHGLTFLAGFLVARGYITAEHAGPLVDSLVNILAQPEMLAGLIAFITGKAASAVRREETKKELKVSNKELAEVTKELKVANKEVNDF